MTDIEQTRECACAACKQGRHHTMMVGYAIWYHDRELGEIVRCVCVEPIPVTRYPRHYTGRMAGKDIEDGTTTADPTQDERRHSCPVCVRGRHHVPGFGTRVTYTDAETGRRVVCVCDPVDSLAAQRIVKIRRTVVWTVLGVTLAAYVGCQIPTRWVSIPSWLVLAGITGTLTYSGWRSGRNSGWDWVFRVASLVGLVVLGSVAFHWGPWSH